MFTWLKRLWRWCWPRQETIPDPKSLLQLTLAGLQAPTYRYWPRQGLSIRVSLYAPDPETLLDWLRQCQSILAQRDHVPGKWKSLERGLHFANLDDYLFGTDSSFDLEAWLPEFVTSATRVLVLFADLEKEDEATYSYYRRNYQSVLQDIERIAYAVYRANRPSV